MTASVSDWAGNTSSGKIAWRQKFTDSALGTDNGAILMWLSQNDNAGGVGLNITIDGQLYQNMDKAVLDSGNYSSYALPITGGTLTGNTTVSGTNANTWVRASNNLGAVYLESAASGNRGIYDNGSGWIIYTDSTGCARTAASQTVGTTCLRNIYAGTAALTDGSSSLTTGTIYIQYE